jgi:type IV pilus assembly protein PilE
MFGTLKSQKGFTLIEVLVVVIIVAILAAIAVPVYMKYVERAKSTEAKTALQAIRNAYDIHRTEYGTSSNYTVEEAIEDARLNESLIRNWKFEVNGNIFTATSTANYSSGEGLTVTYDGKTGEWSGWGIDTWSSSESYD